MFIDEIENGLHYSVQQALWILLLKYAKDHEAQVFVTTHSYEMLESLREAFYTLVSKNIFEEKSFVTINTNHEAKKIDVIQTFELERPINEINQIKVTRHPTFSLFGYLSQQFELRGERPTSSDSKEIL
ncbi:MAG: AAA family ATPase [Vampirovibrionales bacterium]